MMPTSTAPRIPGRRKLLVQLRDAALAGGTVLLVGPVGIGKTTLLCELRRQAVEAGRPCGYAPRVAALGDATQALGVAYPEMTARGRTPRSRRASLRLAAEARPGLLLLDHVVAAGTALRGYLRSLRGTGLGVVIAFDADTPRDRARLRELRLGHHEIDVPPLGPRALAALLDSGLAGQALPGDLPRAERRRLVAGARGCPGRIVRMLPIVADPTYWRDGRPLCGVLTAAVEDAIFAHDRDVTDDQPADPLSREATLGGSSGRRVGSGTGRCAGRVVGSPVGAPGGRPSQVRRFVMGNDGTMMESARRALEAVLSVREGERLVVVTDREREPVGRAFLEGGRALGAAAAIYVLPADRPLGAVPDELLSLLPGQNVAINAFRGLADETPFRIQLIKREMEVVSRLGHCPGITEDMMTAGPMNVDYAKMQADARRLLDALAGARAAHLTGPGGTDLRLGIERRDFQTDVVIERGSWGNLPAGEVWCGPEETKADGILVCDGSIGDLGQVPAPVRLTVADGRIREIECTDLAFADRVRTLTAIDDQASVIGELGIGLNPGARITGELLEDEKAIRTAHIAFGNNDSMPGGTNHSRTHRDFLVRLPTLRVRFLDGSERILIEGGRITI
ncbi:MAG: aminopeptidase [Deltaproteobacteria bacterium]|nr:aminopeptidase [Deltaproteobacteria bacterium]